MIAKTLLLTLTQKKARAILLIFSIAVCASLLFANLGFQQTTSRMIYTNSIRWAGNADLYIVPKQSVGAPEWIDPHALSPYGGKLAYAFNMVRGKALYAPSVAEMRYFTVLGTDMDEFNTYNQLELQSGGAENWSGNRIIMGAAFAESLGLTAGDMITLEINGDARGYEIAGISQPSGLFTRELADGGYMLMPKETLSDILGGSCNLIFVKANEPSFVPELKQILADAFPQYVVHTGVDQNVIQAETATYTAPFWISSVMVLFMSVFIIYSSFNLIVNERIGIIGIMRSVGCTRGKTNRLLILESAVIGVIGGTLGCLLGIGVLYLIISVYFSGEGAVMDAPVIFGGREALITVMFSAVITVLSAMTPVMKTTKIPIKNIILNDFQRQRQKNAKHWPVGLGLLVLCFLFLWIYKDNSLTGMVFTFTVVILTLIGVNMIIPALCRLAAFLSSQGIPYDIALGFRNVGDFKALLNNTRLFAATMAIMILMMTVFNSLGTDLRNIYARENYELALELRESSSAALSALSQTDGVADYYGVYETPAPAEINSHDSFMNSIFGIESPDFFDYSPAGLSPDARQAINTLGDGRYIVTTNILRKKLGLNMGDTLTLQFDNGAFDFEIIGFADTNYGIGHVGFISAENYKAVTGAKDYSKVFVRADKDAEAVKNNILRALSKDVLSIQTKQELETANADKIEGIFGAINTYAYFAMLIGVFGIVNNMAAFFLGRRRNLALYRCVGMTAKSAGRMLMVEALAIGIIGTLSGLFAGLVMTMGVPNLVGMMWGNVTVSAPSAKIIYMCAAGIAAMLLCSVLPFVKGRNISVMDNIRYE